MKKCYLFSWAKASKNVNFCYVFIPNFVQKKKIHFEQMHNFVQTWFCIDTKMMQNFVQKKFRAKR